MSGPTLLCSVRFPFAEFLEARNISLYLARKMRVSESVNSRQSKVLSYREIGNKNVPPEPRPVGSKSCTLWTVSSRRVAQEPK